MSTAETAGQPAFCLSAYNALVVGEIVAKCPLTSAQEMPGFFSKTPLRVAGGQLTLDQIETDELRKFHANPRVHFALACGPNGCPA